MSQTVEIRDNRNNELLTMTFPQRYVASLLVAFSAFFGLLSRGAFSAIFSPPLRLPESSKKIIILAAIGVAIEEVET